MKIAIVEQFKIMLLNRSNRVLGISTVSLGGISGTVTDQKIIFAIALKSGASSIILAHNHPSGNLNPSDADIAITNKIKQSGTGHFRRVNCLNREVGSHFRDVNGLRRHVDGHFRRVKSLYMNTVSVL